MNKPKTIIALALLFSLVSPVQGAQIKKARAAPTSPLGVSVLTICEGTNYYSAKAQRRYNVYYISDVRPSRPVSAEKVIKLMDERWSFNRPRDTWRCAKFDNESSWNEHHKYLQDNGYMSYIDDNDSLAEAIRINELLDREFKK